MRCLRLLILVICGCTLISSLGAQSVPIILGDTYEGRLGSSGEVDALHFEDLSGTLLHASITGASGIRPTVELIDIAAGVPLDLTEHLQGSGGQSVVVRGFPIPSTGSFELRISGSGTFPGSYRCVTRRTEARANSRFTQVGSLPNGTAVQFVSFSALGRSVVSVDLRRSRSGTWNPTIVRVQSPTGTSLDVSTHMRESRGRARLSSWTAPEETGEYLLVVGSRDGSTGDFTVKASVKSPKSKRVITDPGQGRTTTLELSLSTTLLPNLQSGFIGFCRTGPDRSSALLSANGFVSAFYYRPSSNSWSGPVSELWTDREAPQPPVSGGDGSMLVLGSQGQVFDYHDSLGVVTAQNVHARRLLPLPGERMVAVVGMVNSTMPAAYVYDTARRTWNGTIARQAFTHDALAFLPGGEDSFQLLYRPRYGVDLRVSRRNLEGVELADHFFPQTELAEHYVTFNRRGQAMLVLARAHPLGTEILETNYDPALGWSALRTIRVVNERVYYVKVSLANDLSAAVCVVLDDQPSSAKYLVARSIAGGPFVWDLLPLSYGSFHSGPWNAPWVHASPGGEFLLQSYAFIPGAIYVTGAKGTASWSEWHHVAGSTFSSASLRTQGEFCVGVGPDGTGPYLIAAEASFPPRIEIHRLELR